MSDLKTNLQEILQDKNANLLPENLKQGITCLGVTGTMTAGLDTSDATATSGDILLGKTAYVNGEKITGTISDYTPTDWSLNNFELSNSKLLLKKCFATVGFNGNTDLQEVLNVPVPLELEAVIKANKDNLILYYYKDYFNHSYSYLKMYVPKETHKVMITCNGGYSLAQLLEPVDMTLNTLDDYMYFQAVDADGNCYAGGKNQDVKYTEYSITYQQNQETGDLSVYSTSSSTDGYDTIIRLYEDDEKYQAFICLGSDALLPNINNIDELFKFMDWSLTGISTVFGTSVTDISITGNNIHVSNEMLNDSSGVDVTLTEEQTNIYNYADGTIIHVNNPNGVTTKSLTDYPLSSFTPFIRKIKIDDTSYGIIGFNPLHNADIDTYLYINHIYSNTGEMLNSSGGYNDSAELAPTFNMTDASGSSESLVDKSEQYNNWDMEHIAYYKEVTKDIISVEFGIDTDVYVSNNPWY